MPIETVRIANHPQCELNCSYCDVVHSKSRRSAPAHFVKAANKIFPCNTIYRADFSSYITAQQDNSILEIHFLTLTNRRLASRLELLNTIDLPLVVIIDHLDMIKILELKKWDQKVIEYRVIPSQIYSYSSYLNQLPYFIQPKIKWAFPKKDHEQSPLYNEDEIAEMLQQISILHFTSQHIADHNWYKTWDSSLEQNNLGKKYMTLLTQEKVAIDLPHLQCVPIQETRLAQIAHLLTNSESLFVGYFYTINEELLNHLQSRDYDLLYIAPPEILETTKIQANQSLNRQKIYLLQNFLVRKDVWMDYVSQTRSIDEYSWSQFIEKSHLIIKEVQLVNFNNPRIQNWQEETQNYFYAHPTLSGYSNLFLNLASNHWSRHLFFYVFHFIYTVLELVPKKYRRKIKQATSAAQHTSESLAYNVNDEILDASKNIKYAAHRLYWLLHRLYWWIYAYIISPTRGFISSLNDHPSFVKNLPFQQRVSFKTQFILKKLGWLVLKSVGLK